MTIAEKLSEGLMVTILGMGITFVVLTLLWLIMSLMGKASNEEKKNGSNNKMAAPPPLEVVAAQATGGISTAVVAAIAGALSAALEKPHSAFKIASIRRISSAADSSTDWSRVGRQEIMSVRQINVDRRESKSK
ncbi:MAG: OadG family protein [Bacillota bacterium]